MEAHYTGPYRVIEWYPKLSIIALLDDTQKAVSIDRLKPAILLSTPQPNKQESSRSSSPPPTTDTSSPEPHPASKSIAPRTQVRKCASEKNEDHHY